ncbi:TadE/TadG family type IV pilus assembly protein [Sphingomonas sp. AX6]|uniref:TadE/TadG family type IV pilus assembly protein n=1 Tax=Sphingomonas sp. AX6 TaxID=2653171 RepID=UPI0012F238F9|nr:TadE/TadG family type IV pilus assembly protein [Sphingomonas sp. AX6]VXC95249.1 Tight adherence protein TadE [Sphingomonas sp. AX6]
MIRPLASRLKGDERGITIVEFAVVAPVMLLLLMGSMDLAHTLYMRATLQGIMQKAARDASLEAGAAVPRQTVIDGIVSDQVEKLAASAVVTFDRRFYRTFSEASTARAEEWTDTNNDGTCNDGEPYTDQNSNMSWDRDGSNTGQGGAKDTALYTATVEYPRLFPMAGMIGMSDTVRVRATTVLRNQPYADQGSYATPVVRNCA